VIKEIILKSIKFYQKTLSLDHGLFSFAKKSCGCRFYPSCSQYAYEAIEKYGVYKGGYLGLRRLLRCNPFSPGGMDPLV
jgi:putative membrane protein insertion efficiency factor